MRSFPLALAFASGCKYETNVIDQPDETDTDITVFDQCGYMTRNGDMNGTEVFVQSLPEFTLLNAPAVTVQVDQPVKIEFTAGSLFNCGDYRIEEFFFGVYDFTEGSYEWLKPLNDAAVGSTFRNVSTLTQFPDYAAENMAVTPTGDQLFYVWHTPDSSDYGADMPAQLVSAEESSIFEFDWTGASYAPPGRTFTIALTSITWVDVTTEERIFWDTTPMDTVSVEVTIDN